MLAGRLKFNQEVTCSELYKYIFGRLTSLYLRILAYGNECEFSISIDYIRTVFEIYRLHVCSLDFIRQNPNGMR